MHNNAFSDVVLGFPNLKASTDRSNLYILLTGDSKSGKSTWINALVNCLTFKTLTMAMETPELKYLIPFKIKYGNNDNQTKTIPIDNENFSPEVQGITQNPRTYFIQTEKFNLHVVDTPGIGYVNPTTQNTLEKLDEVLRSVASYKTLDAVCWVLDSREQRVLPFLQTVIEELLKQLPRNMTLKFCFFFTHSQKFDYKLGEAFYSLQNLINGMKLNSGYDIRLSQEKLYCVDHEWFSFLCAHHNGVEISKEGDRCFPSLETSEKSWEQSSNEFRRFLDLLSARPLIDLQSHHEKDLVPEISINSARGCVALLVGPLIKAYCDLDRGHATLHLKFKIKLTRQFKGLQDDIIQCCLQFWLFYEYYSIIQKSNIFVSYVESLLLKISNPEMVESLLRFKKQFNEALTRQSGTNDAQEGRHYEGSETRRGSFKNFIELRNSLSKNPLVGPLVFSHFRKNVDYIIAHQEARLCRYSTTLLPI